MKIGFALVTDEHFLEKIVNISNSMSKKCNFLNDLGVEHNLPHTTLFQGEFQDDFDFHEALKQIYSEMIKLNITSIDFTNVQYVPEGWYFYICKKTNELQALHEYTLQLVKDNVVLETNRLDRDVKNLSQEQIAGILNYGYRYSGEAFLPHITLARTKEKNNTDIINEFNEKLSVIPNNSRIQRITVYTMGENGTHKDTLDEIYMYK